MKTKRYILISLILASAVISILYPIELKRKFKLIDQKQNEQFEISKIKLNDKPAYIVEVYSLKVKFVSYSKALRFLNKEKEENKININNKLKELDKYNFLNITNPNTGSNEVFYLEFFGLAFAVLILLYGINKFL